MLGIRRTKEDALETRKKILESALDVFYEKGYSKTTLDDIAERAGVSRGPIYWNFKNKDDIYLISLKECYQELYRLISPEEGDARSPLRSLTDLMNNRIMILRDNQRMRKLIEIARHKTEIKSNQQEILELQIEIDITFKNKVIRLIELGKEKGEVKNNLDAGVVSIAILSYLNGIEDTWLINPDLYNLDEYLKPLIELMVNALKN